MQMVTATTGIKRHLVAGRIAIANLDNILKSRDIIANKVHIVKGVVFPVILYRYESWTIKNANC